jgi:hypothetical protein
MKQTIVVAPLGTLNFSTVQRLKIAQSVCDLERVEYGEGKHRQPDVFAGLIEKNDAGLICAMDGDKLVGYTDVWQLQTRFYDELLCGVKAEEEICSDFVLSKNDANTGCWYIGSVITDAFFRENSPYRSAQTFSEILRQAYLYFDKVNPPAKVMGVGSTVFGRKLLDNHGFKPVVPSSQATDLRPRYQKTLVELALEID